MAERSGFYEALPVHRSFEELADAAAYTPLPDGWMIGTADIVGSSAHVAAGLYKTVNTVGAAVISAQINVAAGEVFPFIFAGDGAAFAFDAARLPQVSDALSRVMRWARDEFDFDLRGAIVPVEDIRAAGLDVTVARFAPSAGVSYAMFSGGGVAWAERQMKAGRYSVEAAPPGNPPDLSGLSCRWVPMRARNGKILSLLAIPLADAPREAVTDVMRRIVDATRGLDRGGHPVPRQGPGVGWPPQGLALEAHASHGSRPLLLRKLQLLAYTFLAWVLFVTGLKVGNFNPSHYAQEVAENADFRKFDDGLKMTLDIDPATRQRLEAVLRKAAEAGVISYGLFEQDEALMTCIVPSVTAGDHIHFVDGAAGGYTTAALAIRAPA